MIFIFLIMMEQSRRYSLKMLTRFGGKRGYVQLFNKRYWSDLTKINRIPSQSDGMCLDESTNSISANLSDELEDFTKSRSEVLDKMLLDSRIFKPITISENIDLYKTKLEELIKRKRCKLKIPDDYDFFEEIFNFASEGFNNDIKKMSTFLAALNFLSSGFEKYNLCGLESPENILTRKGTTSVYSRNKLKEGIRLWNENFVPFQNIYEGYVCILAISEKFLFANDEFSEEFLYAYKYDILKSLKFIFE